MVVCHFTSTPQLMGFYVYGWVMVLNKILNVIFNCKYFEFEEWQLAEWVEHSNFRHLKRFDIFTQLFYRNIGSTDKEILHSN